MITKILWEALVLYDYKDLQKEGTSTFFILVSLFLSSFTLLIDLILLPIEIIALIIQLIIEKKRKRGDAK